MSLLCSCISFRTLSKTSFCQWSCAKINFRSLAILSPPFCCIHCCNCAWRFNFTVHAHENLLFWQSIVCGLSLFESYHSDSTSTPNVHTELRVDWTNSKLLLGNWKSEFHMSKIIIQFRVCQTYFDFFFFFCPPLAYNLCQHTWCEIWQRNPFLEWEWNPHVH